MIKHECTTFDRLLKTHAERGFSILPPDKDLNAYRIVMRTIEKGSEEDFVKDMKQLEVRYNIRIEEEIGIAFCPWCGKKLKE